MDGWSFELFFLGEKFFWEGGKFSFFAKISGPNDTATGAERKALLFFTTLFKLTSQASGSLELDVRVIESMSREGTQMHHGLIWCHSPVWQLKVCRL